MCGRFVSSSPPDEIAKYFEVDEMAEQVLEPSYNVAPTNDVYVVHADGAVRRMEPMHWGLVPIWAKDPSVGSRMINARAETVAEKNAYRAAFKRRRCIIPADGFYEWVKVPGQKRKQPMFIRREDEEPLAFAGLWEVWKGGKSGDDAGAGPVEHLRSCTIITGQPNEKVAEVHDRMPVILPREAWSTWLDPDVDDAEALGKFLVPAPAGIIALHPVSTDVNNVRNKGAHLVEPVEPLVAVDEPEMLTEEAGEA